MSTLRADKVMSTTDGIPNVKGHVIYVDTITDLQELDAEVGQTVYLTQEGRAGEFVVKTGAGPSDPQKGIYIALANGNHAKRLYSGSVNVRWFGALGDGTTDDTAAVKAAILGYSAVKIPLGRYLISEPIDRSSKIVIEGDGDDMFGTSLRASVLLKAASLSGDLLTIRGNASQVKNLIVDGQAGNSGDGIVILGARILLSSVGAFNMGKDGIRIGRDTTGPNCNLFKFESIKAKNNGRHGVTIDQESVSGGLWEANAGSFIDGDLQYNTECGLYLGYCGFNTFINLGCQNNGTYGMLASDNARGHKFYGGDFEVNGRPEGSSSTNFYDFYLSDLSENNKIIGITCYNFPQSLYIGSSNNTVLAASDGGYPGDGQFNGLMLRNIPSDQPTVLDHYEEGIFTPVVSGTTTAGSATYSIQSGNFTRIGNLVTFRIALAYSEHTGTGDIEVSGLPFATSGLWAYSVVTLGIEVSQYRVVVAYSNGGSKTVQIRQTRTYAGASVGNTTADPIPMDDAGTIYISGSYQV